MKKVQYQGGDLTLGRFGEVSSGAVLDLYESEWDEVKGNPDFKLLTPVPSKSEREIAERIAPVGHQIFDLRLIPWENKNLGRVLTARMSKQSLLRVVDAINHIGGVVEPSTIHDCRNMLVDRILTASRAMNWARFTKDERLALGSFDNGEVDVAEEAEKPQDEAPEESGAEEIRQASERKVARARNRDQKVSAN
jgi:hypothetical protein